jgi:ferredoxin
MAKFKIIYDRENCIGAGACVAVDPKLWELSDDDNKADLLKGTFNEETQRWELIVDDSEVDMDVIQESADVCPVNVIEIKKIEE